MKLPLLLVKVSRGLLTLGGEVCALVIYHLCAAAQAEGHQGEVDLVALLSHPAEVWKDLSSIVRFEEEMAPHESVRPHGRPRRHNALVTDRVRASQGRRRGIGREEDPSFRDAHREAITTPISP